MKLTLNNSVIVPELCTAQEEADTRIFLHAKHASLTHTSTVIVAEDTDVLILGLAFFNEIANLYIRCGTQNRVRYIDINKLGASLGQDSCKALIGLHAFTGCVSVSAFGGSGKLNALKLMMKSEQFCQAMIKLGNDWALPADIFSVLQEFTCKMYASGINIVEVNELRYQLFRAKIHKLLGK